MSTITFFIFFNNFSQYPFLRIQFGILFFHFVEQICNWYFVSINEPLDSALLFAHLQISFSPFKKFFVVKLVLIIVLANFLFSGLCEKFICWKAKRKKIFKQHVKDCNFFYKNKKVHFFI